MRNMNNKHVFNCQYRLEMNFYIYNYFKQAEEYIFYYLNMLKEDNSKTIDY